MNLFVGVGFWLASKGLEPDPGYTLYDRVVFDFDSEENPEKDIDTALSFSNTLDKKYSVDSIVFRSGFKGAHVDVPLNKPASWEGYQLLWDHFLGLLPREGRSLVDANMRQWNRLDRAPYTWNIKNGRKVLAEIIHPPGLTPRDFDWSEPRGLDPSNVVIYEVGLPKPQVRLVKPAETRSESKD